MQESNQSIADLENALLGIDRKSIRKNIQPPIAKGVLKGKSMSVSPAELSSLKDLLFSRKKHEKISALEKFEEYVADGIPLKRMFPDADKRKSIYRRMSRTREVLRKQQEQASSGNPASVPKKK